MKLNFWTNKKYILEIKKIISFTYIYHIYIVFYDNYHCNDHESIIQQKYMIFKRIAYSFVINEENIECSF